jgi:hypothetical protein
MSAVGLTKFLEGRGSRPATGQEASMKSLLSRVPTNGGQAPAIYAAVHIDGRALDRLLRRSTASQRAVIADDLRTGRLEVGPYTERQARTLAKASYGYTNIAGKLTEAQRFGVRSGSRKLSAFERREPSPEYFDRLVERFPNQVMAALDRHTAPTANNMTNGNADQDHANDNEVASQQMVLPM